MERNKYFELDKQISKQLIIEGETVDVLCPHCKGENPMCIDCNGEFHYQITF